MSAQDSLHREKALLRKIGMIVLMLGLCSAGLVYWLGLRPQDPNLAEYRESVAIAEKRQMQRLYGQSGGITDDVLIDLKRPGTQSVIIILLTGFISGGCFYLGHPLPKPNESK